MIRPFRPEDKEMLLAIFKLNTPNYFGPKEVNDFENYLKKYGDRYLTVEYEKKIVGGTGYHINSNNYSGAITWIFFHPDYCGLGLEKKAVERCLKLLNQHPSVRKITVTTSQLAFIIF